MSAVNGRRRQYVPLYVHFASGRTGTRIQKEFGLAGLAVWVCYLAACKRNSPQGQITYNSEPDGWSQLSLYGAQPDFTLKEFFDLTGRLKKTSRRTSGHLTDVICTVWGEWEQNVQREVDAARKRRKRAGNTPDTSRTKNRRNPDITGTEGEGEKRVPKAQALPPLAKQSNAASDALGLEGRAPTLNGPADRRAEAAAMHERIRQKQATDAS